MKEKYLFALANNKTLDEISLGATIGLTEVETRQIISDLLLEDKIEEETFGICSFKVKENI